MRAVLAEIRAVASTRASVLLTGETGVGKGVVARELFGHESARAMPTGEQAVAGGRLRRRNPEVRLTLVASLR